MDKDVVDCVVPWDFAKLVTGIAEEYDDIVIVDNEFSTEVERLFVEIPVEEIEVDDDSENDVVDSVSLPPF